jgi:hypothetical protein
MKKKINAKSLIRQIVREEVAKAIKEVISELKRPVTSPIPRQRQVTKAVGKEVQYSNNPIINEVLSETQGGLPLEGQEEWPTMGGGTYDSTQANQVINSSYGNMMNNEVKSNSDIIAPNASVEVKDIFNKDYSGILKASIKKSKGGRR